MDMAFSKSAQEPFIDKYKPQSSKEIQGQDAALKQVQDFLASFPKKGKALLLYGPPGSGKTSLVYAIIKELGHDIVEVNASDYRNADGIETIIGNASRQMSLFMRPKVILVDEVDGVSGTKDRGGIPTLVKIIQKTQFPIIMTANNPWDKKFNALRKASTTIELKALRYPSIVKILRRICDNEGITYTEDELKSLARRAAGDVRGAINDLQTFSITGDMSTLELDERFEREKREKITNALMKVLKSQDESMYMGAFNDVEEDMDEIFLWLEHNVPNEYKDIEDVKKAFDVLSRADIFRQRIRRWQYYRYMAYIYILLTAGIALAKSKKYEGFTRYEPTKRKLDIWRYNMANEKKKSIAKKVAEHTHTSSKVATEHAVPYMRLIFGKKTAYAKKMQQNYIDTLELDDAEVKWLRS